MLPMINNIMKTYIIYRHTLNNKAYIGYTTKSVEERLGVHLKNTKDGSERHFHRAIRKYGVENIVSEILDVAQTRNEAREKERYYISLYNTVAKGYNMTVGGDGGNTIEKYSEDELIKLRNLKSSVQSGMNNSRARPDITIKNIIDTVIEFVDEHCLYGKNVIKKEVEDHIKKKLNASSELIKRRGIKNFGSLVMEVNSVLTQRNRNGILYDPYYRSENEKKQLSKMASEYGWVTDGTTSKQIKKDEMNKYLSENITYRRGRTL